MSYDNTNKGTLGKNKRKTQDTHPEYSGSINIEGKDYWLSAWLKTNKQNGEKFFSLSVKPKEAKKDDGDFLDIAPTNNVSAHSGDDFDDVLPF